ncbi:inovirus-type Gp2 protein [Pseudidiomarina sp. 1APR75-33.1]|nr:inovirus-type Gp2 protein [Pseudidiomarina sp. 1APR75-33.1]
MAFSNRENWFHHRGVDWQVNTRGSGLDPQILRKVIDVPLWMLTHHRKVFLFRFDLSCNTSQPNNKQLSRFLCRIKTKICREHYSRRVAICWAREIHSAKTPHYHIAIALDGSRVNSSYRLTEWIERYWRNYGRYTAIRYYNLNRPDIDQLFQVVWHLSYLAKLRGKEVKLSNVRRFSTSLTKLY